MSALPAPCFPFPPLALPCDPGRHADPEPLPPAIALPLRRGVGIVRQALDRIRRVPVTPREVAGISDLLHREWEGLLAEPAGGSGGAVPADLHHDLVDEALGNAPGVRSPQGWRVVVYDRFFAVERPRDGGTPALARSCVRALLATVRELEAGFLRREHFENLLVAMEECLSGLLSATPPAQDREGTAGGPGPARAQSGPDGGDAAWCRRWVSAHWGFFVLSQGVTAHLRRASLALESGDADRASVSFHRAARLTRGATAALMLASDLPASAYGDVLRPMMRAAGGERGLTGEHSLDRELMTRALSSLLSRLRGTRIESPPLRLALGALRDAMRFDAIEHALAARGVVGDLPSLVTEEARRPVSAVDVLLEIARWRNEMFRFLDVEPGPPDRAGVPPPFHGGPPFPPPAGPSRAG